MIPETEILISSEVILSGINMLLTLALAIAAFVSINQNMKMRKDMVKPNIVPSFETNQMGGLYCLVIRNYGSSSAIDVSVKADKDFLKIAENIDLGDRKLIERFQTLESKKFVIAPTQKLIFLLGTAVNFSELIQAPLKLEISYNDIWGQKHTTNHEIDFDGYGVFLSSNDEMDIIATSLRNIKSDIEKIRKEISRR